jgi:ATP-dependent DNA ligase
MTKKTLFQNNSSGGIKVWTIEVINNGSSSIIRSTAGQQGGKMAVHDQEVKGGKSSGKANATTHFTQACSQAESKYKQKIRKGYVADVTKIQSSSVMGTAKIPQPMLAHKYDPTKKQSSSKNLKEIGILGEEVIVQRKKDGNRCLIHITEKGARMYTRKGDESPAMPHITESLHKSFMKIFKYVSEKYGVTEYWLDGELYTKAFSFSTLNGLVRRQTKDAADLKMCEKIKYHLYDIMIDADYLTRMKIMDYFKSPTVHVEESHKIVATEANLKLWLEKFLAEGEEGLMIRVLGMGYEHKRSWGLCKMKNFEDKEFLIIGIEEDKRGGMAGKVVVEFDQKNKKDSSGNIITEFKPGLSGSHEEWTEMWNNQSKYIGKWATIEFFGRSEYGVPRFPKFKGLRNDAPKKAKKAKK